MKDTVRRLLGQRLIVKGVELCVFCGQGHYGQMNVRGREIWNCRACNQLNATVKFRGTNFTRAATQLERAEHRITTLTRYHRIIDTEGMPFPSPLVAKELLSSSLPERTRRMHYAMTRSAWELIVKRIKTLTELHKKRHLHIVLSWDLESTNWGASISFDPQTSDTWGRGSLQAYGAETAEQLMDSLEKQFNVDKILNWPDERFCFSVSSPVVAHLLNKARQSEPFGCTPAGE